MLIWIVILYWFSLNGNMDLDLGLKSNMTFLVAMHDELEEMSSLQNWNHLFCDGPYFSMPLSMCVSFVLQVYVEVQLSLRGSPWWNKYSFVWQKPFFVILFFMFARRSDLEFCILASPCLSSLCGSAFNGFQSNYMWALVWRLVDFCEF